ncbi:MAG: SulP family inorganic anion transporter [Chthoniobacterales bacterium]
MASPPHSPSPSTLTRYLPILGWLPKYRSEWLRADIIAGLTVWAVMVPEAMAYAGIAGVPALYGLYTVPVPLFAYAIFGTSRTLIVGPDTATAMISATAIGGLAAVGSAQFIGLTATLAFLVGLLFFLFSFLRMGWIANFVPTPVMKGFIQGLVWVTILGQVPKIIGIDGGHGQFFGRLTTLFKEAPNADGLTTLVGLGSLVILFVMKKKMPRVPAALVTLVVAILAVNAWGLEAKGLNVVENISTGLPALAMPVFGWQEIETLLPAAFAIVLLGFSETLGAARAAAERTGEVLDPNQELLSHGPVNVGSAFCSGFIAVGSLSKTSVAMSAGAKTQLCSLVAGVLVILSLLFLMPLFHGLPHATLAAIVIEAMLGLASFTYLKNLRRVNLLEFGVACIAFWGVLFFGVLPGIGLGVALSLILLVRSDSAPPMAVLGKLPGHEMYRDIRKHPEAETISGLVIFRFDHALTYTNASTFEEGVRSFLLRAESPVRQVLVDAEGITDIDTTSMEMLARLRRELANRKIILAFARVRDEVFERLKLADFDSKNIYQRITDGVLTFETNAKSPLRQG